MDPPYQSIQDSFLRDDDANPVEDGNEAKRDLVTHAHREPAKKRRRYNPRKTRAEWDQIKAVVKKLYVDDDCSLEEIMTDLQANRGFEASKDQFKSKIREWKFDKNVKTEEMKHIVRIETRRLPKKTDFRVRNQRVSRPKIERFKKRHSAWPEPPSRTPSVISYSTSYSPQGSPSSDLIASPQLSNVGWYTSYKEYRNNSPEYSFHPVFQNLKKLRIQEDTYELRMFNMSKIKESFLIMEKFFPQDFIGEDSTIGGNNDCIGCTLKECMVIYDFCRTTYDNDPSSLSAEPNLLLWVSEISRLLQSKVERINIHMIWLLMEWSLSNRCVNAVDVFYDIGLEMCRAKKSEDWLEIHYALDMVDTLLFHGQFLAGKTLLRAILKEEFHIIDTPRQNRVPHPKWDNASMQSLYWRRGTTQLDVIRWFLAHPDLTHKIFGDDDIPNFSLGSGPALLDVNLHFCFLGGEDWTEEDNITRDLFGERVCDKDVQLHMFIMLALSRYLPRYGEYKLHDRYQGGFVEENEDENEGADEDDDDTDKDEDGVMSIERDTAPTFGSAWADAFSFIGPHLEANTLDTEQEYLGWTALGSQRQPFHGPGGPPSVFDSEFLGLSSGGCVAQTGQLRTEGEGTRTNVEPSVEQNGDPFLENLMSSGQWDDSSFEHINQAGFRPEETQPILGLSADYQVAPLNSMQMIPGPSAEHQVAPSNMPMMPGPQVSEQVPGWDFDSELLPDWDFGGEQIPDWDFDGEHTRVDIDPDFGL